MNSHCEVLDFKYFDPFKVNLNYEIKSFNDIDSRIIFRCWGFWMVKTSPTYARTLVDPNLKINPVTMLVQSNPIILIPKKNPMEPYMDYLT